MMRMVRWVPVVAGLGLSAGLGCGGGEAGGGAGGGEAQMEFPVDEANAGGISGGVAFQGTAPEMSVIDMSDEQACREKYPDQPRAQTVVVTNGRLQNVFVYVKEGLDQSLRFPTPTDSVVLDQDGCRYEPHVLGIQTGQRLAIRNSDPLLHNINATPEQNRGFNISQPQAGMTSVRTFSAPEVMVPVGCDVHGWMSAYIGVLSHPYFDVTGEDGSFNLERLPPGTYTLEAWHEEYGTQTQEVTVIANQTATVQFTFRPSGTS